MIPFETILLSQRNGESFSDTLQQLLCSTPHIFLKSIFYMTNYLEINEMKTIQIFPQRKSHIVCHVQIDTVSMLELLIDKGVTRLKKTPSCQESRDQWHRFFDFSKVGRPFTKKKKKNKYKPTYVFGNCIETDGYSLSIMYIPVEKQEVKDAHNQLRLAKRKERSLELEYLEPDEKVQRKKEYDDVKESAKRDKKQQKKKIEDHHLVGVSMAYLMLIH